MGKVISFNNLKTIKQTHCLNKLISQGISCDFNSLLKFIIANKPDIVKLFIDSGFDVHQTESNGNSALSVASYYGIDEIVDLLVDGVDINNPKPLLSAISNNNLSTLQILLKSGINPNIPVERGVCALSIAVLKQSIDMIKMLVEYGANVNLRDDKGDTPLMLSVIHQGSTEIPEFLILNGADVNNIAADGYSPTLLATYTENITMLKLLIQHSAKIDFITKSGDSIFDIASNTNNSEIISFLSQYQNHS